MFGAIRGAAKEISRLDQRKVQLAERDARIVQFMRDQTPVAVIAAIIPLTENDARKATVRLAKEHGIEYRPPRPTSTAPRRLPAGLTSASARLRRHLSNIIYDLRNKPGMHPIELAAQTGILQAHQKLAIENGGTHDLKLSNMEQIAVAIDQPFKHMILEGVLTPEEFQKVRKCLNF